MITRHQKDQSPAVSLAYRTRHFRPVAAREGFSLVELLVVCCIMAIMIGLTMPSFRYLVGSREVHQGGDQLAESLMVAREGALAKNKRVEVRFIKYAPPGEAKRLRGVQAWIVNDSQGTLVPLSPVVWLPNTVVVSEDQTLSPILNLNSKVQGNMQVRGSNCEYVGFSFRPTGALISATDSFLSVVSERDKNVDGTSTPANFFSLYINPVTGKLRILSN